MLICPFCARPKNEPKRVTSDIILGIPIFPAARSLQPLVLRHPQNVMHIKILYFTNLQKTYRYPINI